MTEGVFSITLPKWTLFFNGKTNEEAEGIPTENGSESIRLGLNTVFVITKHNNTTFSLKWKYCLPTTYTRYTRLRSSLLCSCLPCYLKFFYSVTQVRVDIRSYGTQLEQLSDDASIWPAVHHQFLFITSFGQHMRQTQNVATVHSLRHQEMMPSTSSCWRTPRARQQEPVCPSPTRPWPSWPPPPFWPPTPSPTHYWALGGTGPQ